MNDMKTYFVHLLALCIIQIVVLDNIHLGAYTHVNIYIMAIFLLPYRVKGIPLLLHGLFLGLFMDLADNTMGVHAAASTFVAYIRPRLLHLTSSREEIDETRGSFRPIDFSWFLKYASLSTLLFNITLTLAEAFSFSNLLISCGRVILGTLASLVAILLYYFIGLKRDKE
jgi:hypothetical protein